MTTALDTFNDILNRHLRPWMINYSPQKYQQELATLKKETYQFQPHYDVDFPKPFNDKRRYYHTVIENAAISFLNGIHTQIETASTEQEKTYWVFMALSRQLPSKLASVNSLIERKNYQSGNISRTNDDAYIIQYLKYQLIRLYQEMQKSYSEEIKDEPLTDEDILSNFFNDPPYEKATIIPEERKLVPDRKVATGPKKQTSKFSRHNHEIREPKDGVLLYQQIVDKPEAFGRIEEILFEEGYIDKDFKFKKGKGKQLVIAAIVHVLRKKKFFKDRTFHDGKKLTVTHLHIHQFISHRYGKNFSQQYRPFKQEEKLAEYLENNLWIKNIASS